jgi:WhiB family transcriptional regulator, redox-sensing transcriptional regulator
MYQSLTLLTADDLPDLGRTPWRERALCRGEPVSIFFSDDRIDRARALALCRACPVAGPCADYAIRNGERGMWGGTNEHQRQAARLEAS